MFKHWGHRLALAALLGSLAGVAFCGGASGADDTKKAEPKPREFETKASKGATGVKGVNFTEELGLELTSLETLGDRITRALQDRDPVVLTGLARELAAAEAVANKKAKVTGAKLLDEALEMVKRRNYPDELKTVAKLLGDGKDSKELLVQADKVEKANEKRGKEKVSPKGITDSLGVINRSKFYVKIYVNDVYVGTVNPYDTAIAYVGDSPYSTTKLYAVAPGTPYYWGPEYVPENVKYFRWTLN